GLLVRAAPAPRRRRRAARLHRGRTCGGNAASEPAVVTRRQRRLLVVSAVAVLLIGAAACAPWSAWLVYNPSDSAPHGWYAWRRLRDWRPGTPVFARPPSAAAQLAHRRGYLPQHLPILKRIGAVGGQHACVHDGLVRIDGRVVALARE